MATSSTPMRIANWRSVLGMATALFLGTAASAQYCTPQFGTGCNIGDQIENFSTTGGLTNISNLNSGCSAGSYSLIPASSQTVTAFAGTSFNFTVQAGQTYSEGHRIWVDWNNDQDFTDPGENVWTGTVWNSLPQSGTINVPGTISGGTYRMRVRCNWNAIPTDPCANQTYGEAEDYEITVPAGFANDAGITAAINPAPISCALDSIVAVEITGYGTDTLTSATINWTHNGSLQTAVNWTGSLAQGESDTVTLSTTFAMAVGDDFEFWSSMPNGVADSNSINDSLMSMVNPLSLNGNYTINISQATTGNNFNNFSDAVWALNNVGVCGPVVFDVTPFAYNEQLVIGEISGASSTNTVTFRGNPNNNTLVSLEFQSTGATDAYTVQWDGGDWVGFEDMTIINNGTTYSRVLEFTNGANSNWINNCLIQGDLNTTTTSFNKALIFSNGSLDENNQFLNSEFRGGSYSMYWRGASTTSIENGTVIENCLFSRWYYMGLDARFHNDLKIRNNVFSTLSNYAFTSYGMYIWYSDGAQEVTGNRIEPINNVPRNGIYFVNCDATNANRALIANNSVVVGDTSSTNSYYAMYSSNSGYQEIVHNTLVAYGDGFNSRALWLPSGGANRILNNNLVCFGQGFAYYLGTSFAAAESDHNNLYSDQGNFAFFNSNQPDLATFQSVSGFETNSVSVDPHFYNWQANDLHICNDTLDEGGKDLQGLVSEDYDGQVRTTANPDIGADEFSSIAGFSIGLDTAVICMGDSVSLTGATDGSVNQWNTGDSTNTIWVDQAGTYSVSITNTCGSVSDTVTAIMNTPVVLPANENICAGATTTLTSNVMGTYDWNNGMASTQSITVNGPGTFSLSVTDPFGCVSTAQTVVTQSLETNIGGDDTICTGDQLTLDAGLPGSNYLWQDATTSQTYAATTSGTYAVTVTDPFGCVSSDQMTLTTIDAPVAGFSHVVTFLSVEFFNSSTGGDITWIFGDGQGSNSDVDPIHTYPEQGTYTVTQIVSNQCGTDTLTDTVVVSSISVAELSASSSMNVYPNPNNGQFTLTIEALETEEFDVHITDVQGRVIYQRNLGQINGVVNTNIQLDQVAGGLYFVKVFTENGQAIRQLIIE